MDGGRSCNHIEMAIDFSGRSPHHDGHPAEILEREDVRRARQIGGGRCGRSAEQRCRHQARQDRKMSPRDQTASLVVLSE